jgi:fructokinase
MSPPLILALGEILWDLLPAGKQLGGAPANFAYHAAQLGADSRTISAVGDDALGNEILARLRELKVDPSQIAIDREHPTGTVTVTLNVGQPTYTIHEGVAWDFIRFTPALLDLAARADCICFGTLAQRNSVSRQTIQSTLAHAKPDALLIFDINLRQNYYDRANIENSLCRANVLKINHDEITQLSRLIGCEPVANALLRRFPNLKLIALTRGGEGSVLFDAGGSVIEHPGYPADPMVDAIGAGDAFTAALALGLLRGDSLKQISDDANRLAAYVCTRAGATPAIPASFKSDGLPKIQRSK